MYTASIPTPETTLSSEIYNEPNFEINEKQEAFENQFNHWIEAREFPQPLESRLEQLRHLSPYTKSIDKDLSEPEPDFFLFNNYQSSCLFYSKKDLSHQASLEILNNGNTYLANQIAHNLKLEAVINFQENEQELQKMSVELQEFGFAINKHISSPTSLQILYRPKDDYRVFTLELPTISLPDSNQDAQGPEDNQKSDEANRSKGKWTGGIAEINSNSIVNHTEVIEGQSIYSMKIEKTKDGFTVYDADGNEIEADNEIGTLYINGQKISTAEFAALLKDGEVISQSKDNNYKWTERYNLQGDLDNLQEGKFLTIEMICDNEQIKEEQFDVVDEDSTNSMSNSFRVLNYSTVINEPAKPDPNMLSNNLFATTSDILSFFELSDLFQSNENQSSFAPNQQEIEQKNFEFQVLINRTTDTNQLNQINSPLVKEKKELPIQKSFTNKSTKQNKQGSPAPKKLLFTSKYPNSEQPSFLYAEDKPVSPIRPEIQPLVIPTEKLSDIENHNVAQQLSQLELGTKNPVVNPPLSQVKSTPTATEFPLSNNVVKYSNNNISIRNFLPPKTAIDKRTTDKSSTNKSATEKTSFKHKQNIQHGQKSKVHTKKESLNQNQQKISAKAISTARRSRTAEDKTKQENAIQKLDSQKQAASSSSSKATKDTTISVHMVKQENNSSSREKASSLVNRNIQNAKRAVSKTNSTETKTQLTVSKKMEMKSELKKKNRQNIRSTYIQNVKQNQEIKNSKSKKLGRELPGGHIATIRGVIENIMERYAKQAEFQNTHNQVFLSGQDGLILNKQIRPLEYLTDEICSIVYRNSSVNLYIEISENFVNFKPQINDPVLKAKILTNIDREFKILSPELKIAGLEI